MPGHELGGGRDASGGEDVAVGELSAVQVEAVDAAGFSCLKGQLAEGDAAVGIVFVVLSHSVNEVVGGESEGVEVEVLQAVGGPASFEGAKAGGPGVVVVLEDERLAGDDLSAEAINLVIAEG